MEAAIAGPATPFAKFPMSARIWMLNCVPSVERIVPTRSDANKPFAIALMASIKYLFAEKIMFFFKRNSLNLEFDLLPITIFPFKSFLLFTILKIKEPVNTKISQIPPFLLIICSRLLDKISYKFMLLEERCEIKR